MRKQFDLEYYLAHPETKVVTRDGRDARILCTDLNDKEYPIAASCINLIKNGLDIDNYAADGKVLFGSHSEHVRDLFFDIPDPEKKKVPLTTWDLLERIRNGKTMWIISQYDAFQIIDINEHETIAHVNAFGRGININDITVMEAYRFADGDPCWKEVDE